MKGWYAVPGMLLGKGVWPTTEYAWFSTRSGTTEEPHLVEMVVKSEYLSDAKMVHNHLARAVSKGPHLILIELFKHCPSRLFKLFADMHDHQDTARSHQVNGAFERHGTCIADIVEQ